MPSTPASAPAAVVATGAVSVAEPQLVPAAAATPSLVATLVSVAPQDLVAELDRMSQRLQLPMPLGQSLVASLANIEVGGASLHVEQLWERLDTQTPLAVAWVLPKDVKSPNDGQGKGFCAALTFRDDTLARRTRDDMGSPGEQRGALVQRRSTEGDSIWTAIKGRTLFVSGSPEALLLAGGLAEAAQVRPARGKVVATVMPQALAAATGQSRAEIIAHVKALMAAGAATEAKGKSSAGAAHMAEAMAGALTEMALDSSVVRILLVADSQEGVALQGELVPMPGTELAKLAAQRLPYAFDARLPVKSDSTAIFAAGDWQTWIAMASKMFEATGPAGRATAKQLAALVAMTGPWSCVVDPAAAGLAPLCSSSLKAGAKPKAVLDAALALVKSQQAWEAELEGRKPSALKIKRSGDEIEIEKKIENKDAKAQALARALVGGDVLRSVYTVKDGKLLMASGSEAHKLVALYGKGGVASAPHLTAALAGTAGDEMMASIDVVSLVRRILIQSKDLPGRDVAVMASAMPGVAELSAPFLFRLRGGSSLVGELQIPFFSLEAIANVVRGLLGAAGPAR